MLVIIGRKAHAILVAFWGTVLSLIGVNRNSFDSGYERQLCAMREWDCCFIEEANGKMCGEDWWLPIGRLIYDRDREMKTEMKGTKSLGFLNKIEEADFEPLYRVAKNTLFTFYKLLPTL